MAADSSVQLITLLAEKRPREIIGTPESEWVDFKSAGPNGPYDLGTDKGKFELAKDVAAFANVGGGLIVCGFRAKRRPTELYEVATKELPFDQRLVNVEAYKSVIKDYVRPLVKVTYTWFDHPEDDPEAQGHYLVIEVTGVPEEARWALVTRSLSENEKLVTGGWTVPIRHGDDTVPLQVDTVYRLLNDGYRAWSRPAQLAVSAAPGPADAEEANPADNRRELRQALSLDDVPVLFFQSTPNQPQGLVDGMYADGGLYDVLRSQDALRGIDAFNFASIFNPERREGGLRLAQPKRLGIDIASDGAVTAAAAANGDMLGWAMERYAGGAQRRISVFVLTELILEYFRLVDRHLMPRVFGPWTHRIVALDFARDPARTLAPGDDPSFPLQGAPQPATSNDWNHHWTATGDPEHDAYQALGCVYHLFGLDVTTNPFTEGHTVSTEKLLGKSG